jgi:hypothetical protein
MEDGVDEDSRCEGTDDSAGTDDRICCNCRGDLMRSFGINTWPSLFSPAAPAEAAAAAEETAAAAETASSNSTHAPPPSNI